MTDVGDLVAVSDIARRLGVESQRVSMWIQRHGEFPQPVMIVGGRGVYSWRAVAAWCRMNGHLGFERGHIYDAMGNDVTSQYTKRDEQ